jgi:regulatory protein
MNKKIENSREDALKYALKLLSYRDRSEKEIYDRLTKSGFSTSISEDVILFLKKEGLLNDWKYAEILKKNALERKFLSKNGLKRYLINRGIPDSIINSIVKEEDDYLDSAINLISKKLKNSKNVNEELKHKLLGSLLRRGFSYEIAKKAFKIYFSEEV